MLPRPDRGKARQLSDSGDYDSARSQEDEDSDDFFLNDRNFNLDCMQDSGDDGSEAQYEPLSSMPGIPSASKEEALPGQGKR